MANNAQELGRIREQLERGQEDRREMREDLKGIRQSFQEMHGVFTEMRQAMTSFNKRTDTLEKDVAGEDGIKDRVFVLEQQVKSHEEVISGFKKLIWRAGLGAIAAAALSGGVASRITSIFGAP